MLSSQGLGNAPFSVIPPTKMESILIFHVLLMLLLGNERYLVFWPRPCPTVSHSPASLLDAADSTIYYKSDLRIKIEMHGRSHWEGERRITDFVVASVFTLFFSLLQKAAVVCVPLCICTYLFITILMREYIKTIIKLIAVGIRMYPFRCIC